MEKFWQFDVYLRNKKTGKWEYYSFIEGTQDEIQEYIDNCLSENKTDVMITNNSYIKKTYTFEK